MTKVETLNKLVSECPSFLSISKEMMLVLPTGDGMVIGFTQGTQIPWVLLLNLIRGLENITKERFHQKLFESGLEYTAVQFL